MGNGAPTASLRGRMHVEPRSPQTGTQAGAGSSRALPEIGERSHPGVPPDDAAERPVHNRARHPYELMSPGGALVWIPVVAAGVTMAAAGALALFRQFR